MPQRIQRRRTKGWRIPGVELTNNPYQDEESTDDE